MGRVSGTTARTYLFRRRSSWHRRLDAIGHSSSRPSAPNPASGSQGRASGTFDVFASCTCSKVSSGCCWWMT